MRKKGKLKDRKIINNEERVSKRKGHRERRGGDTERERQGGGGCEKIENRTAAISRVQEGGEGEGKGRKKGLRDGMNDDVSTY